MASIGDVAKRAGVSLGTASRAINGNPAVSPQLRERVLVAAAELDYRPNALARALRSSRTHSLGLIVPDVTNPFFGELAKQPIAAIADIAVRTVLRLRQEDARMERHRLPTLLQPANSTGPIASNVISLGVGRNA